jgi:hypothetical protein
MKLQKDRSVQIRTLPTYQYLLEPTAYLVVPKYLLACRYTPKVPYYEVGYWYLPAVRSGCLVGTCWVLHDPTSPLLAARDLERALLPALLCASRMTYTRTWGRRSSTSLAEFAPVRPGPVPAFSY